MFKKRHSRYKVSTLILNLVAKSLLKILVFLPANFKGSSTPTASACIYLKSCFVPISTMCLPIELSSQDKV